MIEVHQVIKYVFKHPTINDSLEIIFLNEKEMDIWIPHLNKFEDYLIQEAINAKKKQ